jgi:hypothetical protein
MKNEPVSVAGRSHLKGKASVQFVTQKRESFDHKRVLVVMLN